MASAANSIQESVTFAAFHGRTRRECRLLARALMRMPRAIRVLIGIAMGILVIASLYGFLLADSSMISIVHAYR